MQQFEVSVSDKAASEISLAYWYYDSLQDGLGEQFLTFIDEVFTQIARLPMACPVRHLDARGLFMKRYPYHIYYRTSKKTIRIIAFFHQAGKPVAVMGKA